GVELLAEAHDVDATLTERRPDGRRRRGGAGGHLQLDVAENLLGHFTLLWGPGADPGPVSRGAAWRPPTDLTGRRTPPGAVAAPPEGRGETQTVFSTCSYSSSTGVARPKMETDTRRRARSSSTLSTTPSKLANGPSVTLTFSPMSKRMVGLGRSTPSSMAPTMRWISRSLTGIGLAPEPRKPVTLGVFLIR